jgi:hypothetical protein
MMTTPRDADWPGASILGFDTEEDSEFLGVLSETETYGSVRIPNIIVDNINHRSIPINR